VKAELLDLLGAPADPMLAGNLAREYLQGRILLAMQEAGAMIPLAFQGGTALRFLYSLPRFSEDLDFALERPERGVFDGERLGGRVAAHLQKEGYDVVTKLRVGQVVKSITIAFPGLLHEAGFSPNRAQRLGIRIEVDTKPPRGAGLTTTIVRRQTLLNLQHHDRPSLLAGKVHAILQRRWTKGRDLFDLFWYLSDPSWPAPNLLLLNNALVQTGWTGQPLRESSWRTVVGDKVASMDWDAARRDVAPFLEPGPATGLFGRENLLQVLARDREGS
jgi:hypothetical protein